MTGCRCRRTSCVECKNRRHRKDTVRDALRLGGTVPWSLRTLVEDGWSVDTIRKVYRDESPRTEPSAFLPPVTFTSESGETLTLVVEEAVPVVPAWAVPQSGGAHG